MKSFENDTRYILCIGAPMAPKDVDNKNLPVVKKEGIPPEKDFTYCKKDFDWKLKVAKEKEPFIPKCKVLSAEVKLEESGIKKTELLDKITEHAKKAH